MTKRAVLLVAAAAAVVATSETALLLQLRDCERARRRLAAHRCPPVFEEHPPAFERLVLPAPAQDPALSSGTGGVDPVYRTFLDQPAEVRRA